MAGLKQSGGFAIDPAPLGRIREGFDAGRADIAQVDATIARELASSGYLFDPHTAAAAQVAGSVTRGPIVVLSTAHPAKFPDAVECACGIRPQLPSWLAGMMQKPEKFDVLPSDVKMVEEYVSHRARAGA